MRILLLTDHPFSSESDHRFSWETDRRSPVKAITLGAVRAEGDREGRTVIGMRGEQKPERTRRWT